MFAERFFAFHLLRWMDINQLMESGRVYSGTSVLFQSPRELVSLFLTGLEFYLHKNKGQSLARSKQFSILGEMFLPYQITQ